MSADTPNARSGRAPEFRGTERFRVLRRLGEGGMGVVFLVEDTERNERVALKTLFRGDPSTLYRFKKEFRALAEVSHPNLVVLHELISEGDRWLLTMEYVDGVDFLSYVGGSAELGAMASRPTERLGSTSPSSNPPPLSALLPSAPAATSRARFPSETRLRDAFAQLARGVSALHDAGKLHRDLKPSNVLVTHDGRVVVLDFGMVDEARTPTAYQTLGDRGFGTPAYMSPEQAAGAEVSEASDWYAYGVMLFEALTGTLPIDGRVLEILYRKEREDGPAPSTIVSGIPSDLDTLCELLLRRDPKARPSTDTILARMETRRGRRARAQSGPIVRQEAAGGLVGREEPLAALREAFEQTRLGVPSLVLVEGESGIGKTALVQHFARELRERQNAVVLAGRCYERESLPFKAIDTIVDALARYLRERPTHEVEAILPRNVVPLGQLFPVLRQVEAFEQARGRPSDSPDPQERRRRGLYALRELLCRLSDRVPLAMHIDDLQWGDAESATLLAALLSAPEPPALLVLGCLREGADAGLLAPLLALHGEVVVRRMRLGPLALPDATNLALVQLGVSTEAAGERARAIAREAEGSPFFVGELARASEQPDEGDDAHISLERTLQRRVAELPRSAANVLRAVAVAGEPIEQAVILRAAGLGSGIASEINVLRVARLARTRGARPRDRIECYHDRIRVAVLGTMSPGELKSWHEALVHALEATESRDWETLAIHARAAGDPERAARHALAAARAAEEALAFDRAVRWYRLALESIGADLDARGRIEEALARALVDAGRSAESADAYLRAVAGASPGRAFELERCATEQLLRSGHVERGFAMLERVLGKVGMTLPATPQRALASLLVGRARVRLRGLQWRERRAEDVPVELLTRVDTCWSAAVGLGLIDFVRGGDFQARHLLLALDAGEPYRLARALALEAGYLSADGAPTAERVERVLESARELARRIDRPHATGLVVLARGMASWHLGLFRRSVGELAEAERIFREKCTGATWEIATAHIFEAAARFYLGQWSMLARLSPEHLAEARARGDLYAASDLQTGVHVIPLLAAGDVARARNVVEEEKRRWSRVGFHLQHWNELFADCLTDLYEGDGLGASRRLDAHWDDLRSSLVTSIQAIRIEANALRAQCALVALAAPGADRGALVALARRATRSVEKEHRPWAAGLALVCDAALLHASGSPAPALVALERAVGAFVAAEMMLHAAAAERRLGELRGGEEGAALVARADEAFRAEGVLDPARMCDVLAPPFTNS